MVPGLLHRSDPAPTVGDGWRDQAPPPAGSDDHGGRAAAAVPDELGGPNRLFSSFFVFSIRLIEAGGQPPLKMPHFSEMIAQRRLPLLAS